MGLGGRDELALRVNHLHAEQAVAGEPQRARDHAEAAPEREPGDAHGGAVAAGDGEPVLPERLVEGPERHPCSDDAEPVLSVDGEVVEVGDVDDDPVAQREPLVRVAAAAHADADVVRAGPADGAGDVAGRLAEDDRPRVDVEAQVDVGPRRVVSPIPGRTTRPVRCGFDMSPPPLSQPLQRGYATSPGRSTRVR